MERGADTTLDTSPQDSRDLADAMTSTAPLSTPSLSRDIFAILVIIGIVILLALFLTWPWLPQSDPAIDTRNGFQPLAHGQAASRVTLAPDGTPLAWASENITSIPAWETFGDQLPPIVLDQLLTLLPKLANDGTFPPATTLFHSRVRTLDKSGEISSSDSFLLRRPESDEILAISLPSIDLPLLYNPPLVLTVNYPESGSDSQSGTFAGIYTYTLNLEQSPLEEVETPYGIRKRCQRLFVDFALILPAELLGRDHTTSNYCDQFGMVSQFATDTNGKLLSETYPIQGLLQSVSTTVGAILPPIKPISQELQTKTAIEEWLVTTFAHSQQSEEVPANSIPPLYVNAERPFLLTARREGPLVALAAEQPNNVIWQFQTAGSVYSQPTIDRETGYLYFGSSDKNLYSITNDGLYLWRAPTDDNVASQPLIIGGQVFVASESGTLYALDKATGAEEWKLSVGSAMVATPAYLKGDQGEYIVVGSDAGIVSAIDPTTGFVMWETILDKPIHVSLRASNEVLYASTLAALYALSSDGKVLWSVPLLAAPSSPPAIDSQHLFIVDTLGWLYAINLNDGKIAWRSQEAVYVGEPMRLTAVEADTTTPAEYLLMLTSDASVRALSTQGDVIRQWNIMTSETGEMANPTFSLGITSGGSAFWFADDQAKIYRIGPQRYTP